MRRRIYRLLIPFQHVAERREEMKMPRRNAASKDATAAATETAVKTPATSATVTLAGVRGTFTVDYDQNSTTIADIVTSAAQQAGVPDLVVETLAVVVNGEDAALDDDAPANGARVAAAPRVRNG
jgi:hypothetical protein